LFSLSYELLLESEESEFASTSFCLYLPPFRCGVVFPPLVTPNFLRLAVGLGVAWRRLFFCFVPSPGLEFLLSSFLSREPGVFFAGFLLPFAAFLDFSLGCLFV